MGICKWNKSQIGGMNSWADEVDAAKLVETFDRMGHREGILKSKYLIWHCRRRDMAVSGYDMVVMAV